MPSRSPARSLTDVCGATAGTIGLAALLGWSGQLSWLGAAVSRGPGIRPVTGACLLALSLALATARRIGRDAFAGAARWALGIALVGAGAFAIRLLYHLFFGIGEPQRASSPHTVSALMLLGIGVLLSINATRFRRQLAIVCALTAATITWLALLGYVTAMPMFFAVPGDPSTGMSVVTAIALLIISVGVMGLFPQHGFVALFTATSVGGTLMRVLLPAAVLFPLALGGLLNHGQTAGWFGREVGLALNLGVTSVIMIGLVLWIGLIFKRRDAEQKAAEAEREQLLANLRTSLDDLNRLQNDLVVVCAWTQRVLDQGKWVRFEEFLDKRLNISVSHGISEEAAKEELQNLEEWMAQPTGKQMEDDAPLPRAGASSHTR